jgi:hypothetical protein
MTPKSGRETWGLSTKVAARLLQSLNKLDFPIIEVLGDPNPPNRRVAPA